MFYKLLIKDKKNRNKLKILYLFYVKFNLKQYFRTIIKFLIFFFLIIIFIFKKIVMMFVVTVAIIIIFFMVAAEIFDQYFNCIYLPQL